MSPSPFYPYFKSEKIAMLFAYLLKKPAKAKELAELIHTESKQIYPRLRRYILKGWVIARKSNNVNLYSLSEDARKILSGKGTFEDILKRAEDILHRKLDEDEVELLRFLYENKNTYIERSADRTIAEVIYDKLNGKISLRRIEEILSDFTESGIIFAFRLRNGMILKIRLNKKLLE
ncbi:conjugal transfer protein [Sulfolobus tengchongensis]|uniref:Conjugal transfer protein n=1 Tax=Sulfolobus tengchongensis TaxID=207809 RepID=A0AAX4L2V9_9CREN